MALMCKREQELLDSCDATGLTSNRAVQRAFLTDHLLTWVDAFCDDLTWKSRGGFYVGIAETLKQFMTFEMEEFDISNDEIKYPKLEDSAEWLPPRRRKFDSHASASPQAAASALLS